MLQGRITTQGDPCSHYREWVCSEYVVEREVSIQERVIYHGILFQYVPVHSMRSSKNIVMIAKNVPTASVMIYSRG